MIMKKLIQSLAVALLVLTLITGVAAAAPVAQEGGQEYIVQADDWLSKLAEKNYGMCWPGRLSGKRPTPKRLKTTALP
jgi:hypothetical protein